MSEQRLGRGLKHLFAGAVAEAADREVDIQSIIPNRLQPRRSFDPRSISELSASIRQHGVLQPLVVRKIGEGRFELISGERRLRAAREAGLIKVPVVVREAASDREILELALVENLQRADLDPIDKARGFRQLSEQFGLTQEQIAERVGQDRTSVANHLRLLDLPEELQEAVSRGTISMGHARALLGLSSKDSQLRLLYRISSQGLSVRDVEGIVRDGASLLLVHAKKRRAANHPAWLADLEERIQKVLSTRVRIQRSAVGRGKISIEFATDSELERISKRMGV